MNSINQKLLKRFLILAGDRLIGDWVLIGGTVLPVLGIEHRVTNDIDIVGPPHSTQKDSLILMEIALELKLPIESINQAGAFFLRKIKDWDKSLVKIHVGKSATLYRPNINLFIQLKLQRLSESDLADCIAFLKYVKKGDEKLHSKKILKQLRDRLESENSPSARDRILALKNAIESHG